MERLAGFAGITKDDVVLDVGCGDGRSLLHLASTVGCRGVGIDIDEELVGTARRRPGGGCSVCGWLDMTRAGLIRHSEGVGLVG